MDARQIEALKSKLEKARVAKIRAEATRDEAFERLKELGFDSIEQATEALDDMQGQIQELEDEINRETDKLENQYPELMEDL